MMKLWSGSGKRAVKRGDAAVFGKPSFDYVSEGTIIYKTASVGAAGVPDFAEDLQNVIDFESFLSWYNENNFIDAAGNELANPHSYEKKRQSLKFLSL